MGSVSAPSGPDTELQVPDEILQKIGIKTSFSKDVPKLSNNNRTHDFCIITRCAGYLLDQSGDQGWYYSPITVGRVDVQSVLLEFLLKTLQTQKSF